MLEVTGVNKGKVGDVQGWCSSIGTVDSGWVISRQIGEAGDTWRREKSWAMMDSDPDSLWSA